MDDRPESIIRSVVHSAGKRYEEAERAYRDGRDPSPTHSLPQGAEDHAKIVCRHHAEYRTIVIDAKGHPTCFDPGHPDCQDCVDDIREGMVETWQATWLETWYGFEAVAPSARMDCPLVALVLVDGTGTRLYPTSRSDRPRQFLPLGDDRSLLTETVARADFTDHVAVSARPAFAGDIANHVPGAKVVVEPATKDIGPTLAYATHRIATSYDDPIVVVLPSDHHVGDGFAKAMTSGTRVATDTDFLVTFGVEPICPETGYDCVEPGTDRDGAHDLAAFHEKPDAETAAHCIDQGYLQNVGMFTQTPETLFSAAHGSPPSPLLDALDDGNADVDFAAVEGVSIDYAVMERAASAAVVPANFEWDDLGSWDAPERIVDANENGNVALGDDPMFVDTADDVVATDGATVSLVGVSDFAVVAWGDRVLVVPKEEAQKVHGVVSRLKRKEMF